MAQRPRLLIGDPRTKRVLEHPSFEMALENGLDYLRPSKRDVMDLPERWDLMLMPDTVPVGYDPTSGEFRSIESFEVDGETITPCAVAVHPPPGYVRAYHPAAEYLDKTHPDKKLRGAGLAIVQQSDEARPGLPLWAYTAVGSTENGPVAALFQGDETSRWAPELFYQEDLDSRVESRLAAEPENQVLAQIAKCGREYKCCCAQNVFYERWEGAVPIAPACTAACLGCLSKDPEWDTPVPQKRLKFSPTPEEIASVMAHHLEVADEPMMSFGQGCEGEPCMNGDVLVESVRLTRERTQRGIININTNGSRPEVIRNAARAGTQALRISINTFDKDVYTAYYRPGDYELETVIESLYVGRDEGMHVSINFLIWPGWTDRQAELEAVSKLVEEGAIQMIQLRNLCVDPGHFRSILPPREKRGMLMGMRNFVLELHKRHPELRFGTFNPRLAADWYDEVPSLVA